MKTRDTWIEVDLDQLNRNIQRIQTHSNKALFAVVKANAYGHGDVLISKQCLDSGAQYLCVSSLDEALHLRNQSIDAPILVMGYVSSKGLPMAIAHKITTTIISKEWLVESYETWKNHPNVLFHIKIDTGMNRLGIKTIDEYRDVIELLSQEDMVPEGIYTHFIESANVTKQTTQQQSEKFERFLHAIDVNYKWIHTSNTDATFSRHETFTNAVRCGLAMYGYSTIHSSVTPILSLYTRISQIKQLEVNESVSYGSKYVALYPHKTATLPIGYADGLSRQLTSMPVFIKDAKSQIIGTICMDQCMISLDGIEAHIDDVVELIGKHQSAQDLANRLSTIPYEILTSLSDRITRCYVSQQTIIAQINQRYDS